VFRCLALGLLCSSAALAQPLPPLVTDRPDFTESGVVIPLGHAQVESGISFVSDGSADLFSGPELLVRWTPLSRLELRFGAPDYVDAGGVDGFGDPSLGVKVQLGPFGRWDLGVIAITSLPLGDDAFSSGTVDPELILAASYARSERSTFGGQFAVGRDGGADVWYVGGTLVQGLSLPADAILFFDERWGLFVELAATVPKRGGVAVLTHAGFTFAASPTLQLDLHSGTGLTDAAPDHLFGVGISVRR
jgi:hypothetical protein